MAQDDEKTTVETTGDSAEAKPAAKGPNKLVLFGGIGVGVVIVGVVLALFVLKPMMSGPADEQSQVVETSHGDEADSHAEAKPKRKPRKSSGDHGEASASLVYAVKDIVVNPAGTGGTRFLSVSFGFELGSPELMMAFEEREPVVRDALITILSSKTVAQLTDAKQKEIVRYQIKKRLQQLLGSEEIEGVYYTDFVLQ
jgi:flagellar FliL protein